MRDVTYSIARFMRGEGKYPKNEDVSRPIRMEESQKTFSSPESYYVNREVFCTLKPRKVSKSGDVQKKKMYTDDF